MAIISASRRCDIPAHQHEWLMNRIDAGFVTLPAYRTRTGNTVLERRVSLAPEDVDCIVLWTKDIRPMLASGELHELKRRGYAFYIQHTLNPYGVSIEPVTAPHQADIIAAMREVAETFGRDALVWRYDPILMSETWDVNAHLAAFEQLCGALEGATDTCITSFLDVYGKLETTLKHAGIAAPTTAEIDALVPKMAAIAQTHHLQLQTCAEARDLSRWGVTHAHCIDADRIERVSGHTVSATKDPSQRRVCDCIRSIDIGAYNTCRHNCRYCYANSTQTRIARYDPTSDLAGGIPR